MSKTVIGILIPFIGTAAGAACVFFMKKQVGAPARSALTAFAAGVMAASSVWSLILPAIEQSAEMGRLRFIPAVAGFWLGAAFMQPLERLAARLSPTGQTTADQYKTMLAVVLHNIPEGMAVGVVYAGLAAGDIGVSAASAFAFALGIAIQNFPEGAIISMPLCAQGTRKGKSFFLGALSGAVEPVAAAAVFAAFRLSVALMPYVLSFAAGAMIWVAAGELIPEASAQGGKRRTAAFFSLGATLMMIADVAAG